MKTLKIAGDEIAEICRKYDDGRMTVDVPLRLNGIAEEEEVLVNTRVELTSAASKNAKGAISSMVKVAMPYQAFDQDLTTGKWVPSKRRSGAPVACHIVLTIPSALQNDDAAGCPFAKTQLAFVACLRSKLTALIEEASMNNTELEIEGATGHIVGDVVQDEELKTRMLTQCQLRTTSSSSARAGKAVYVDVNRDAFPAITGSGLMSLGTETEEDVGLKRAIAGKPLLDCTSPTYQKMVVDHSFPEPLTESK